MRPLNFLYNIFAPQAPSSWEEIVVLALTAILATSLVVVLCAMPISWMTLGAGDGSQGLWSARSTLTAAWLAGALLTAFAWTLVVAWVVLTDQPDWRTLIPYWSGVCAALVWALVQTLKMRNRAISLRKRSY